MRIKDSQSEEEVICQVNFTPTMSDYWTWQAMSSNKREAVIFWG
jgi:hypothetical protein